MSEPSPRREARELDRALGTALVSVLSGISRDDLKRWLTRSSRLLPDDQQAEQLRFAHEMFMQVAQEEGTDVARAWFIGANVGEDKASPVEAIRDRRFDEVRVSARGLIEDQWS